MKKTIPLIVLLLFVVALATPRAAHAVGAAYFPQATTVTVTVNGNSVTYTISAASDADQFVARTSSFVITISSGQRFIMTQANGKDFTNDSGYGISCSGESTTTFDIPGPASQKTITVTPSGGTPCAGGGTSGGGSGGGGGGGAPAVSTPTPSPTTTSPSRSVSPSPSPSSTVTPSPLANPAKYGLKEGDTISAAGSNDPDVYIINDFGFKRLFLNPKIFNFYGHLGGFAKVKSVSPATRNAFITSGLFRNCETNDKKVYGVEITGEDIGMLHWVNTTGAQAVADDPVFFKKVFCINSNESNWYPKGAPYTSVSQIPLYQRSKQ